MRDFIYDEKDSDLEYDACFWLEELGLRETRWILDADWFLNDGMTMTFNQWINE